MMIMMDAGWGINKSTVGIVEISSVTREGVVGAMDSPVIENFESDTRVELTEKEL